VVKVTIFLPLLLRDTSVNCFRRNCVFVQDLSQFRRVGNGLNENDDLVEIKGIDQVDEFLDLLVGLELDVVLLQAVQGQLGLILDKYLGWVAHKFAAGIFDVIGQRRGEHHHLLVVRGLFKDFLDITSHTYTK
jgi:hypothetical protein